MKKLIQLFAVGLALAAMAFAQRPGRGLGFGPGVGAGDPAAVDSATMIERRVARLAKLLDLTEAQKISATQIFTDAAAAAKEARTGAEAAREAIAAAIKTNNTVAIETNAATLGTIHGKTIAIESKAQAAFYALLTADQKTKYDELHSRRPRP
jgi:Spy/CpxP family protein refolding chaperone